ncbi:hypothetical protein [Allokutzneria albata]|uniref:Uncharacterized protein n=1 Tax=Allokutzneria albata TaxID=211114 RepID=A0A1G9QVA4_ALLAB|nr:hypothetical protein [Allokutzneria albata]SDM14811.1 hypothetical protein SAMN04489726_0015 [Allokutzneria albata]
MVDGDRREVLIPGTDLRGRSRQLVIRARGDGDLELHTGWRDQHGPDIVVIPTQQAAALPQQLRDVVAEALRLKGGW